MKGKIGITKGLLLLAWGVMCCGFIAVPEAVADTVTLVADEWCPINCEPGAARPGYAVEIAKYAFERAGHSVEYKNVAWSRALEEVKKGKYTAAIGASESEAPELVYPRASIGRSANSFFIRKDNGWTYVDVSSYQSVCVAVIRDYGYDEPHDAYFEENEKNAQRVQMASGDNALEQNLKKLAAGRVDVVIEDEPVGRYAIQELGLSDKVKYCCNDGSPVSFYIAFSPANPKSAEYAEILSKAVEELRTSGQLTKILGAYGLTDWQ